MSFWCFRTIPSEKGETFTTPKKASNLTPPISMFFFQTDGLHSLKLIFSPLKMHGSNTSVSFWVLAYVQGYAIVLQWRVHHFTHLQPKTRQKSQSFPNLGNTFGSCQPVLDVVSEIMSFEQRKKPLTLHNTGCLIGILIMVYSSPYIPAWLFTPTRVFSLLIWTRHGPDLFFTSADRFKQQQLPMHLFDIQKMHGGWNISLSLSLRDFSGTFQEVQLFHCKNDAYTI